MSSIIRQYEAEQQKKLTDGKTIPDFAPGDSLRVNVKIIEGSKERVQAFEGVCIGRKNSGLNSSFTVRKISYGEGVERVFPVHSPLIDSIEVVRRGRVRRAKLYYLRGRRGKAARIPERQTARGKQGETLKGFTRPKGPPDDLKLIAGITLELEEKLNKLGLIQFEQIANLSDDEIARLDETLGHDGQIENDDWASKAVALMAETTADEVPAGEDEAEEGAAEEAPAEAKAPKAAKAKEAKPAKKAKKS